MKTNTLNSRPLAPVPFGLLCAAAILLGTMPDIARGQLPDKNPSSGAIADHTIWSRTATASLLSKLRSPEGIEGSRANLLFANNSIAKPGPPGAMGKTSLGMKFTHAFNATTQTKGQLLNIATRLRVQPGDNTMIGGFIVTGTQPKTVIVRGIGPSVPLPGVLADPVIEVHGSAGELLATNDNWKDAATKQQIIDSGLAPTSDLESALWGILKPGAYTVVVNGKNNATGIGLFEVYDLDTTADSKLANISTRGFVDTGDDVMIGGVIVGATGANDSNMLVRALGPTLGDFGIENAMQDPMLELRDSNGHLVAVDDNWRSTQEAQITATGLQPGMDEEAAIVVTLPPGAYTAIVRGENNATGVALVEVYNLDFETPYFPPYFTIDQAFGVPAEGPIPVTLSRWNDHPRRH